MHAPRHRLLPSPGIVLVLALLSFCLMGAALPNSKGPRVVAAQVEMGVLRDALNELAIFTGFFVSLESLNDLGIPTTPAYDFINNSGGSFVLRPEVGFFQAARFTFNIGPFADINTWPQSGLVIYPQGRTQLTTMPYDQGSLLDPWFEPYYFFSPHGLLRGDAGAVTQELYGDAFDRYAIVSLGPDAIVSGDDLILLFATGLTSSALSALSGPEVTTNNSPAGTSYQATAGSRITLRGYGFGALQGSSGVFFASLELTAVVSWSSTRITLDLPPGVAGSFTLTVRLGGFSTNGLALTLNPLNAAHGWSLY